MYYSSKENVNILTALLVAHGVRHAVVCPGSRNAPIVHNLEACPDIQCHPLTDERSAGFCALGMIDATNQPVVVCVTSGSALLNLAPAVAEAYYRHRPLVVVSADRPPQWIDQLDGQTLPQLDALGRFVAKAVTLPEPADDETRWYCERLVNEALLEHRAPVHINIAISEPLFDFSCPSLPAVRCMERIEAEMPNHVLSHIGRMFMLSKRPMLISGQPFNRRLDEMVMLVEHDESYVPDLVVYVGLPIVSKRVRKFLRRSKESWLINETGEVSDPLMNLTKVIVGDPDMVVDHLHFLLEQDPHPFVQRWQTLAAKVDEAMSTFDAPFSQLLAVRQLEMRLSALPMVYRHYANSTAIRLANSFATGALWCNRGVNGIEGSLSTAVGQAMGVSPWPLFCVIGDLSFFYDQNALWNNQLPSNLRILLLNNGGGGIFRLLPGLEQSPARDTLVSAAHHTTAAGICQQYGVGYRTAVDADSLTDGLQWLVSASDRPLLLEVTTDAAIDEQVMRSYYQTILRYPID